MADSPFGPGTVLAGRFTLEDLLDESGGARFWRATDQILARNVAVHVIPDTDPRAASLLDGARSSALVSDVHLLRVLDAAAADGVVYVVNEWGSGVSLDRLLAEGVLSPRRAAWVVKEVAEAITTAHRNGVAHGRLLPENVMISETGTVKLIGFVIDGVLRSPNGPRRTSDGGPVGPQESDVLNLAGLLYAALVGRWPGTEGSTVPDAPTEHGRPLRPRRVRAGVPRPLDAICEQVLNAGMHPAAAPIETAHEIQAALSDFIGDPGGSSTWDPAVIEPTAVLDRTGLEAVTGGDSQVEPGAVPEAGRATARSLPAVGAEAGTSADPEATQAGTPLFDDEDGSVGWLSPGGGWGTPRDGTGSETPPGARTRQTRPAPPAPPPEPPARPLFADEPTAATTSASRRPGHGAADGSRTSTGSSTGAGSSTGFSTGPVTRSPAGSFPGGQRSTGAGNGHVPPVWGPDADQPPPVEDPGLAPNGHDEEVPGRTWLRLAVGLVVALAVVLATVFAFDLGRDPGTEPDARRDAATSPPKPKPAGGARVPVTAVTDFDPQGDPPEENPDLAPLAADGKPATSWKTSTYRGNPKLGGLKDGVGLLVDLGKPVSVGEVRLTLAGSPTSLQILAAPDAEAAPSSTDGLSVEAEDDAAGTGVDVKLTKTVSTRWLVVWLTSLPPAPGGYQGRIAEISVRS